MAKVELTDLIEPTADEPTTATQTVGSVLMSVGFWLVLMVSAVMYAAVSLSPKLADWISVRQQYASNAGRLKQLEDEADYLERVAAALKSDPEFARRLVRSAQTQVEDSEFIPVSQDLLFGETPASEQEPPQVIQPAIASLVFHLAGHQQHRRWLIITAAGLTLLAFTLLNDAGADIAMSTIRTTGNAISATIRRYRAEATPEPVEDAD
jgi:cell division protein FtsB